MFDILTKLVNQTDRAPLKLMTQIKTVKKLARSLKNFVAELHPPYDWTLPLLSGVKPESGMISLHVFSMSASEHLRLFVDPLAQLAN